MNTTSVFAVIGCHRDRSHELLLQGEDGRCYAWSSPTSEPLPIEEGELTTEWQIDDGDRRGNDFADRSQD